ncbi:lytic transglycosylase domain-containing protein [Aliikangiella sp. G2MR2-5]|uniref:lytic murein transglycosylase n=1 Tax=Aliikangiella sp. G2MR2-5 TaxID=2788943 RepID=UPI0018A8B9DC|nr:lytic murein transglycosylase [Aliikangiella sp. G2MR2-5]
MFKRILVKLATALGISVLFFPTISVAKEDFAQWKLSLKPLFLSKGVNENLADEIIASLNYIPRVIELDRRQPEGTMTHEEYLSKVIPEWKVKKAREKFKENLLALRKAESETGVGARFIAALWGKESHFGKITGNFHVPSALATLAYDGRRAEFFRSELIAAAQILSEGHITIEDMKGSWAGAMGHCQFMPSSFLRFARDGDGDGKKDIWSNKSDVFLSMGNYLARSGWDSDGTWGRQVKLTRPLSEYPVGKNNKLKLSEWQQKGVRRSDMSDLPNVDIEAYLIAPGGEKGRIYLVYNNFDVIMRWNRSHFFATGVGYLADRIGYPKIKL